jgi:hypothetical protein
MIEIGITGSKELEALAGRLTRAPAAIQAQLRARTRPVGEQMKTAVQRNALAIPVHGDAGSGLRRNIAGATRTRVLASPEMVTVRVWVDPAAMPAGQEKLPALMEGPGWTHQVFGNPDTKVFQQGHRYFKSAVDSLMPTMRLAVDRAITDVTRTI